MFSLLKRNKSALNKKDQDKNAYRLPKNSVPSNYTVCFKPFVEDSNYEGCVAIDMTLLENSKIIFLNAMDLQITKMMWEEDITLNRQEPIEMSFRDKEQLALSFDPFLTPQNGQFRINFRGKINEKKMIGIYRYKIKPDREDYNLVAQFQPLDARRCFPCADDPATKAIFDICLIVERGLTVVGNMPIKVMYPHKKNPLLKIVEFKQTPTMSTYSIAFVVGSFDYIEGHSNDNEVVVRVYTPKGKKEEGRYALEMSCKALPFISSYFKYPFPLQKLDHVALAEFPQSATESWGIILYQESHLLTDTKEKGSAGEKQNVALNVSEGIIKQWIGGLVAFQWWSQIWFKEGISTFLRYFCLEEIQPDFESSSMFVTEIVLKALQLDGYKSTNQLEMPVSSAIEVEDLLTDLVRDKGAACLRMLHGYIGDDNFRSGVSLYLNRYKYSSATTTQLWSCFEEVSSKPVNYLMSTWINHKGFPLVKVQGKQDGKNRFLKLTQEKFSNDPYSRETRSETFWAIPLAVTSANDPTSVIFQTLMDSKTTTIVIPDIDKSDWIKINPSVVGFYRVRYPADMLTLLVHGIRSKSLGPLDRLNILDDQFALLIAGMGVTVEVLTLMEAYVEEDDLNVWCTISTIFDKLLKVFAVINLDDAVRHFGRYVFSRIYERTGFFIPKDETHQQKLLRHHILTMMTKMLHHDTLTKCISMFENEIRDEITIPADMRFVVFHAVMHTADEETVKSVIHRYKETELAEEKSRIANCLGVTTDYQMIKHVLEFSISEDVRKQDTVRIIISAAKSKIGRELAWSFFKDNFVFIKNHFGPGMGSRLIKGIVEDFALEDKALDVIDFFKINNYPGTERAVQLGVDSIRINDSWIHRERNLTSLQDYMEADAI